MSTKHIQIRGARTHNLKNVDLDLPRDELIVLTGLSGSGKSSLAFDTLYAEGQRRYVESLSAYARQFLSMMDKPDVDHIEGLSPAISIEQKSASHNPRSTVGTVTEIHDYLRLLFARAGTPRCPEHGSTLEAQSISQMVDQTLALPEDTRILLLAPVVRARKGEHTQALDQLRAAGFLRVRIDGRTSEIGDLPKIDKRRRHDIEVVVDRLRVRQDAALRLAESFETALDLGDGVAQVAFMDEPKKPDLVFSNRFACPECGYSIAELEPRLFSFNSPLGACPDCDGLGVRRFFDPARIVRHPELSLSGGAIRGWDSRSPFYFQMIKSLAAHYKFDLERPFESLPKKVQNLLLNGSGDEEIQFHYANARGSKAQWRHAFEGVIPNMKRRWQETESSAVREELGKYQSVQGCESCGGARLNEAARNVFVDNSSLPAINSMSVTEALRFTSNLNLAGWRGEVAEKIVREIQNRLQFLADVGLGYLTLDRSAETLSGGEAQRIRLASQIGSGLVGVMYILDEPSIGLHQRDNGRLLETLINLRNLGNTVIVVEHDSEAILAADHVVDLGPGAGVHGGRIVAAGSPDAIKAAPESLTGQYLSGKRRIPLPMIRCEPDPERTFRVFGAAGTNLKDVDVEIPAGLLTCVTGVSGSGKSTLINDTVYRIAAQRINGSGEEPARFREAEGVEIFDRVIEISQSPIGRTPRSNPATYTGLFTPIRELFAATQEARSRGYAPGRFSFNVKGGRCEACQGDGVIKVEMHFLPDVYVTCDACEGKRYNRETLDIRYKGKNISEVLKMTVEDGTEFFRNVPQIARKLETLMAVGLGYIQLGQNATTLSGGEAQRVKLSKELSKRATGSTLYVLDEPTTGLHFHDIAQLLEVLYRLRDQGNTVVVIEHNLDVIKTADWIIDLGPEGGAGGGRIVATGPPELIVSTKGSHTGEALRAMLPETAQPRAKPNAKKKRA
ncbi:MAG TPA: excinuclease ABC subunit UvrA [Gammaproteobacteria bacterium]|nr:excinuclease ABC subunit UvrA [Gammaproteobacteria bacterium]